MTVEKLTHTFMILIMGAMIGWIGCVHYYQLVGLWGVQNQEKHLVRVVVPQLANVAKEAEKACETNAGAALNNNAAVTDLKVCPKVVLPKK